MATRRKDQDLGERKHVRIDLNKPGYLIPAPDAPWIECTIVDVSERGACLDVGAMPVPKVFGLAFTGGGEVLRVCSLIWRRGERVGARFVTAKELRQGFEPAAADPRGQDARVD
jgi:PilZ domain